MLRGAAAGSAREDRSLGLSLCTVKCSITLGDSLAGGPSSPAFFAAHLYNSARRGPGAFYEAVQKSSRSGASSSGYSWLCRRCTSRTKERSARRYLRGASARRGRRRGRALPGSRNGSSRLTSARKRSSNPIWSANPRRQKRPSRALKRPVTYQKTAFSSRRAILRARINFLDGLKRPCR